MKYLANVTTLQYSPDKCAGCGRCVEVCPQGVFELRDKRAELADRDRCMECGACALNCEFGAITVNAGVGCAAAIINGMVTGGPPSCDCGNASAACCG
jgi:NAD-dependent dihydropyrimidine dehydrogenase PreA subunit